MKLNIGPRRPQGEVGAPKISGGVERQIGEMEIATLRNGDAPRVKLDVITQRNALAAFKREITEEQRGDCGDCGGYPGGTGSEGSGREM